MRLMLFIHFISYNIWFINVTICSTEKKQWKEDTKTKKLKKTPSGMFYTYAVSHK